MIMMSMMIMMIMMIMTVMMIIAARPQTMGEHVIGGKLKWLGWGSTAVMGFTVAAMFASA